MTINDWLCHDQTSDITITITNCHETFQGGYYPMTASIDQGRISILSSPHALPWLPSSGGWVKLFELFLRWIISRWLVDKINQNHSYCNASSEKILVPNQSISESNWHFLCFNICGPGRTTFLDLFARVMVSQG